MTETNSAEAHVLKSFIRDGLGCGCPDEVFTKVQIERKPNVSYDINVDYLITIGDRLLIGVCLSETLDKGIDKDIKKSLSAGKQLRDNSGYKRFRLVVISEEAENISGAIQEQFAGLGGLDDRVHLHVVRPSVIPGFLAKIPV